MRAMLGVISLLMVLAAGGILAARQLKGADAAVRTSLSAPPASGTAAPAAPVAPATGARAAAKALQERVHDDVSRALQDGAARRDAATQ